MSQLPDCPNHGPVPQHVMDHCIYCRLIVESHAAGYLEAERRYMAIIVKLTK